MIGWKELLILLVIVLLIFGTKRLKNIGKDVGEAVKGFKQGVSDDKSAGALPDDSHRETTEAPQRQDENRPR